MTEGPCFLHYSLGTTRFCTRESYDELFALEIRDALRSMGAKYVIITDTRQLGTTHNNLMVSEYKPRSDK